MTTLKQDRMRHRSLPLPLTQRSLVVVSIAALGVLSAGCEIIVDFNRALIEGGVDGSFSTDGGSSVPDTGTSVPDAAVDGLAVPDAVADVVFVETSCGTCVDAKATPDAVAIPDAHAGTDATTDAHSDGAASDAHADGATDAAHPDAASDAHADGATDAATDAASKG